MGKGLLSERVKNSKKSTLSAPKIELVYYIFFFVHVLL